MLIALLFGSFCFIFGVIVMAIMCDNRTAEYEEEIERLKLQLDVLNFDFDRCKKEMRSINEQR